MTATLHISKNQLDYFRKLARECPLEIQAYLIGTVSSTKEGQKIVVESVIHPRYYSVQTKDNVQPTGEEYSRAKSIAEERGLRVVGDIHSHPEWDAVLSPADHDACISDGLQVAGIVSVKESKTKVRFWMVNSALPCDIKYSKKRGGAL
jgi:proteasome lid subunit RPN8/RPN11